MPTYDDARGLSVTAANSQAAEYLSAAVDEYLDYRMSAPGQVKKALEADPDCVMAHYFRACFLQMLETGAILPKVRKTLAQVEPMLGDVTARERGHIGALAAWADGDIIDACRRWEAILVEFPYDILALKLHHYLTFWTGRHTALRAAVASVLPAWDGAVPGYASVQGMYAFALEECGEYADAERWGRAAVERNGDDLWAIHAVAHVLEMQGRSDEGVVWLDYSGDAWTDRNPFQGHLWWHAGLFNLAQGHHDRVLELYDEQLLAVNSDFYVDMQNQVSLLKRLELAGVDVGDRWLFLADHAETRVDDHILSFNDVHFFLALAADERSGSARRHLESMTALADHGAGWTADTMARVTVPLCEALLAYETGDYADVCDRLWPIRNDIAAIGGSRAQRDLFAQVLVDAALRSGRHPLARSLLAERVSARPSSGSNWRRYAEVLDALGETRAAAAASERAAAASEPV